MARATAAVGAVNRGVSDCKVRGSAVPSRTWKRPCSSRPTTASVRKRRSVKSISPSDGSSINGWVRWKSSCTFCSRVASWT